MRKAELRVVGEDGAQAEVVFFHFGPGQGGSVEANIQRWIGQFQDGGAATAEEVVGSSKVHFVKVEGTFLSGMPGTEPTPKKGYGMRGAILQSPEGDVYIKMTGPAKLVEASEGTFRRMVVDSMMRAPH